VHPLASVLALLVAAAPALPALPVEERLIVQAALAGAGVKPADETMALRRVESALTLIRLEPTLRTSDTQEVLRIPLELLDSVREHNQQRASMQGVVQPSANAKRDRSGYVSRPGISRDGSRAFLVIDGSDGGSGVLLEKSDGAWRVIARGPTWRH
jgi:hypothetical protein